MWQQGPILASGPSMPTCIIYVGNFFKSTTIYDKYELSYTSSQAQGKIGYDDFGLNLMTENIYLSLRWTGSRQSS